MNQLTGSIPSSMASLYSVQAIFLHENHLNGTVPAAFAELPALRYLTLDGNQISGRKLGGSTLSEDPLGNL
jgi:Leucine rich repeat